MASIPASQRNLHIVTEAAAIIIAPLLAQMAAQNTKLTVGQRALLAALVIGTFAVDATLLSRWR